MRTAVARLGCPLVLSLAFVCMLAGVATAGPAAECRRLCRELPRRCAATATACRRDAVAAARASRAACASARCRRDARTARGRALAACGGAARRCRGTPLADCRRMLREPDVLWPGSIDACPETPAPACTGIGPDDACPDALHPADAFFWDRLHAGDYDAIPEMLRRLETAAAERPDDPSLVRHVAWTHIWRLGELARGAASGGDVAASVAAVRPGFARARDLNPGDSRVLGFLAAATLAVGLATGAPDLIDEGNALFVDGIAAWPEFNTFSSGYLLSQLPRDSADFQRGLEQQWRAVDLCGGGVIDRRQPDLVATFARETRVGRLRACWNSWIAPFNVEGFLLNLGDMVVKDGQVATGLRVYEAARQVANYDRWPYRHVLEQRIADAAENATLFAQQPPVPGRTILFNSPYSCMACHQAR